MLTALAERTYGTSPCDPDTDLDGVSDGDEGHGRPLLRRKPSDGPTLTAQTRVYFRVTAPWNSAPVNSWTIWSRIDFIASLAAMV